LKKGNNITTPLHVSTNMQENYITFQWQHRSSLIGFGLAAVSFVFISGFRCTYQLGSCSAFAVVESQMSDGCARHLTASPTPNGFTAWPHGEE